MRPIGVVMGLAAVCALAACGHEVAPGPGSAATGTTPPSAATNAGSTTRAAAGAGSSSAGLATTTGSPESRFASLAAAAYPGRDPAQLAQQGRAICVRLGSSSAHDVVGTLAGELSDQGAARRLVEAAAVAYCPGAAAR